MTTVHLIAAPTTNHAVLGLTLLFGLMCAIPSVILAGPVYGQFIARRVHLAHPGLERDPATEPGPAPDSGGDGGDVAGGGGGTATATQVRAPAGTRTSPSRAATSTATSMGTTTTGTGG